MTTSPNEEIRRLTVERDRIDQQVRSNIQQLDQVSMLGLPLVNMQMGVGMDSSLVDSEGYPLPNLDWFSIRTLRAETKRTNLLLLHANGLK